MPRSSRSKSHKQSKHSSKEAAASREYSGSDEDVKMKEKSSNGGKEDGVSFRISKDSSVSGERRKHGKDLFSSHGNGDLSEEYTTSSKRREEKSHGGSDRWNGGSSDEKGVVVNIENKESLKSKDSSKVVGESKSKSSRRHDAESASVVVLEKDEGKSGSGSRGEKRKSEKESARKESSQHKENKESKDKERGSDRSRKAHPDKPEVEGSSKQVEGSSSKRGKESTEWPIEEGLRNPELEKELEKRMRRRGEASSDKDKYQDDTKESDDRRLSAKRHKEESHGEDGVKETRQRDEKHREDGERDRKSRDIKHRSERESERERERERHSKHRDDKDKDKHREDKYSEDGHNRETKYKEDKYKESDEKEERSRDGKRKQDDEREREREYRHKEDKDREKRSRDSKYKDSHSLKDVIEPEAKRIKDDSAYDDRGSRYKDDKDRRRSNTDKEEGSEYRSRSLKEQSEKRSGNKVDSSSERGRMSSRYADVDVTGGHSHSRRRSSPSRDHHRVSKQEESKHRDYRSTEKVNDMDKSPSSPGQRSGGGSKDAKEHHHPDNNNNNNEYPQVDGDNLSVSSPYTRSSSHFRPGSDSPFFENKSNNNNNNNNNRHRRMNENNMNRNSQGNWKNVPSWPSPMTPGGGYMPFQHVPPPMFHPLMQQFPPPIFGRPPMKMNPGLPYHVADHGRPMQWREDSVPPPLHGWDGSNAVFGDESHMYGWDRRGGQMGGRGGWENSSGGEMWKGQSGMDARKPSEENWSGQGVVENEQSQVGGLNGSQSSNAVVSEVEKVSESVVEMFEAEKEEDNNKKTSLVSEVYLSRVDVSNLLTQPELYQDCKTMMDLDLDLDNEADEFECNILFLEEEGIEEGDGNKSTSQFGGISDSVFEKAMYLYNKQKGKSDSISSPVTEVVPPVMEEKEDMVIEENADKEPIDVHEEANKSLEVVVDHVVVKQEQVEEKEKQDSIPAYDGGLVACKVEQEEEDVTNTNNNDDDKVGGGESKIEFGSKVVESLSHRIHDHDHHSPEKSTH